MVNQSREKFFQKRSKRELQFLCRNLGIPFGQRKDLLANTLAALPDHYFDPKYRSSQATIYLSSLPPRNSPGLCYNDGPVQSYADFARYSLGHNIPNNQFVDSNSSALNVEIMNIKSASTRKENNLDLEYGSANGSFSQAVPQCDQSNFDSNGLHLPGNCQNHLSCAGYVQAHSIPNDQLDNNIYIAPLAAGIRKKREEYFLRFTKKELMSLCRKIQLPLTSTKRGLARNLSAMPECYFDPEYKVDFDSNGLSSPRPSSTNHPNFIKPPGECNVFNSQFKDINICTLSAATVNIEPVSTSKEVNTCLLADTTCFQPVPQYDNDGFTNQEIADKSSPSVPRDEFPNNTSFDKSCTDFVRQCDGTAPTFDALPNTYGRSKYIEEGCIVNTPFKDMTATKFIVDSVTTTKANSSSFEFHVRSDRGINLYVDLNSNLSSWAESLNRDVHMTESMSCKKAQTFQEDIVHFAESKLQKGSVLSLTTQNHERNAGILHCGSVLISEDKNSSSHQGMGVDVPMGNEERQVLYSLEPDSNTENQICVARTVGNAGDKVKVDSFGDLSGSMPEGAASLARSKHSTKSCYRCFFWPYGCDKCSMIESLEKNISEATNFQKTVSSGGETTVLLCSEDKYGHSQGKDGDVPKHIEENQVLVSSKPDSNTENQISVASTVRHAWDSVKMDSLGTLSGLETDGATSLITSERPSKLATGGCYRCFSGPCGCDRCSMSDSVNMKILEAADFQMNLSSRAEPSCVWFNQYSNAQCGQGLSANSSHGTGRSHFLKSAENVVRDSNGSGVQSSECSQFEKLFDRNSLRSDSKNQNALSNLVDGSHGSEKTKTCSW